MSLTEVFSEIETSLHFGGDWCSLAKAHTLAALILSTRPAVVVEIGVFLGGSLVPMLIALRQIGQGKAYAIDPWAAAASIEGETGDNAAWWASVDHDQILEKFKARLAKHKLEPFCEIVRAKSDDASPINCDVLHVDGSHREQAFRDVQRFGTCVRVGGFMILDDLEWIGGHVTRAHEHALKMGFVDLYPLGSGIVMQRTGHGAR